MNVLELFNKLYQQRCWTVFDAVISGFVFKEQVRSGKNEMKNAGLTVRHTCIYFFNKLDLTADVYRSLKAKSS